MTTVELINEAINQIQNLPSTPAQNGVSVQFSQLYKEGVIYAYQEDGHWVSFAVTVFAEGPDYSQLPDPEKE